MLSGFKNAFIIRLFWLSEYCYTETAAVSSVLCVSHFDSASTQIFNKTTVICEKFDLATWRKIMWCCTSACAWFCLLFCEASFLLLFITLFCYHIFLYLYVLLSASCAFSLRYVGIFFFSLWLCGRRQAKWKQISQVRQQQRWKHCRS